MNLEHDSGEKQSDESKISPLKVEIDILRILQQSGIEYNNWVQYISSQEFSS
ncbi:hypothetical protein PASE110613_10395 [Paenibacillus sediminis]|uniref:Uncharacterized protein n=1 Tax=Paenibacillus sediminis TaxID=664909 RepID=A0ABS4H499_9BACL|nr:hypothetical protein [Paenibacillus sediminis]MBP1937367.1 hypothetical protein [Paenibacillus sediminis]